MNKLWIAVAMSAAWAVSGCKLEDVDPPSWEVVLNGQTPGTTVEIAGGEVLGFTGDAQDDTALDRAEFEFSLHEGAPGFHLFTGNWVRTEAYDLDGEQALVGRNWLVPDSVSGEYVLTVRLFDAVGLSAPETHFTLRISNPAVERVTVDSLNGIAASDWANVPEFAAGDALEWAGQVFDADGLNDVVVTIERNGEQLSSWTWPTPGGLLCNLGGAPLTFPEDVVAGERLTVHIRSLDGALLPAHAYFSVQITS